jgi:probable rRNA maturation factor
MILKTSAMTLKRLPFKIQIVNRQRQIRFNRQSIELFCSTVLRSLDQPVATLSVVLAGEREIHSLNSRYRQRDYATDVLSFSYQDAMMEGIPFLGEIVIAPEVAVKQAIRRRTTPERELRMLLLHGILHLLGYDHETDRGRMNRIQTGLMRRKFFMEGPQLAELDKKR